MHTFSVTQQAHKIKVGCVWVCGLAFQLLMNGLSKRVCNM